ncbi:MAG: HI0074 family nucleotidyltransferase substrate-binding subunit [Eubacteriales bacterium]|nr:HI0074 family nucleotidyltransferase substrate-binding subunit [Eubacteriales bacterium]
MKKFENYCSNLNVLSRAGQEDLTNEFIIGGIIDKFHIQFELGWKVLKELLKYEGRQEGNTGSPREILKAAYTIYGFIDEDVWISMLKSRNSMTHIYDGAEAFKLVQIILDQYIPEFIRLRDAIQEQYASQLEYI